MIAFGHTAVGTLVGIGTYQLLGGSTPVLATGVAFGVAIASHYITDLVPHGHLIHFKDYKKKVKYVIVLDLALSVLLFSWLAYSKHGLGWETIYILAGIAGAQLPDVLDGLIYTGYIPERGIVKIEAKFHQETHWHGKFENALMWGRRDIWQITTVLIALGAVLWS